MLVYRYFERGEGVTEEFCRELEQAAAEYLAAEEEPEQMNEADSEREQLGEGLAAELARLFR